jgi:hypothetical protein
MAFPDCSIDSDCEPYSIVFYRKTHQLMDKRQKIHNHFIF